MGNTETGLPLDYMSRLIDMSRLLEQLERGAWDSAAKVADDLAHERFIIERGSSSSSSRPYLTRWTLLGRRDDPAGVAVYLHRFQDSDATDELHDHPWGFTSQILAGGYWEVTPAEGWRDGTGPTTRRWYGPGSVLLRPAECRHAIQIPEGQEAWTLVIRGPRVREWGFWCPDRGFRHWRDYHRLARGRRGQRSD
jgi:hypothetical protein